MKKPLIGLPGRRKVGAQIDDLPANLDDHRVDLYFARYADAVIEAGGIPIHIPLSVDPLELVDRLDGVLLSGGADIEPHHYGATPDGNGDYEPLRDRREFALLRSALANRLPVLGICRGLQVINVGLGGSMNQHKPEHSCYDIPTDTRVHELDIDPTSTIGSLYGPTVKANSLHHQTLAELGEGLVVVARDGDGSIEAIEDPTRPLIGVQWHPEMHENSEEPIFDWLVEAASERSTQR